MIPRAFYDREPAITIRQYAPYLVAEVTVEGKENMREALSDGFRQVLLQSIQSCFLRCHAKDVHAFRGVGAQAMGHAALEMRAGMHLCWGEFQNMHELVPIFDPILLRGCWTALHGKAREQENCACAEEVMGFNAQVANYIFGNNEDKGEGSSEKIQMTSPVISSAEAEDFRSMKGGPGEKIAMTSPVGTDMQGGK